MILHKMYLKLLIITRINFVISLFNNARMIGYDQLPAYTERSKSMGPDESYSIVNL